MVPKIFKVIIIRLRFFQIYNYFSSQTTPQTPFIINKRPNVPQFGYNIA